MKRQYWGMLCSNGAAVGFGCGSTALKMIYANFGQIPFEDLSLLRSLFCLVTFLIMTLAKDPKLLKTNWKELLFFALAGFGGLFIVQYFLLLGLQLIPVGVCTFTQASSTIMVCLFSFFAFREKISRHKLIGIVVGLVGLAFVVWRKGMFQTGDLFLGGILAALASAVGKTVYLLCGKVAGKKGRRLPLMAYGMVFCAMLGMPFASEPGQIVAYFADWKVVVFLALYMFFFSAMPYFLTFKAVEMLPASTAGTLNVLEPVAGAISAFLILGEPLSWNQLVGAAFIIGSVFLIHRDVKTSTSAAQQE